MWLPQARTVEKNVKCGVVINWEKKSQESSKTFVMLQAEEFSHQILQLLVSKFPCSSLDFALLAHVK